MKRLLLLFGLASLLAFMASCQATYPTTFDETYSSKSTNVTYKNDTIYNAGKPYALMTGTHDVPALSVYSVRTLLDSEIAIIRYDRNTERPDGSDGMFRFTFIKSGAYGHLDYRFTGMVNVTSYLHDLYVQTEQGFAEAIVQNDLIKNNMLNPEGERRFLLVYPPFVYYPNYAVSYPATVTPNYTPVMHGAGNVQASGGTLTQTGTNIGTYSTFNSGSNSNSTTIRFYLPNGVLCAQAVCLDGGAQIATVTTLKDNRSHTVPLTSPLTKEEMIGQFLANNGYL